MITFIRFRATNAGPFKKIDLNLNKRGLVRMTGPNGVGKSSAFHLFTQNAYSTNPNGAKKTDLQFEFEDDFLLETTFYRNKSLYVAAQAVKSKILSPEGKKYGTGVYLFRDGQDISMHRDPDTQKLIRQTFGWSLEEWYGYVYLAQKSTHTLVEGTRSERQTYLSALFNLTPLDVLAKFYSTRLTEITEKLDTLSRLKDEYNTKISLLAGRALEILEAKVEDIDSSIQLLNEEIEILQTKQALFMRAQTILTELEQLPESKEIEELEKELMLLRALQAEYEAHLRLKQAAQNQLRMQVAVLEPVIPKDFDPILSSPDIDEAKLQAELDPLRNLEEVFNKNPTPQNPMIPLDFDSVLASPDIPYAATLKRINTIENRPPAPQDAQPTELLSSYRKNIVSYSEAIAALKVEIKPLEYGESVCSTCGTTLNCKDRGRELELKTVQMAELQKSLKLLKEKLTLAEVLDLNWQEYNALGPDLSSELPELKASTALYVKRREYQKIKQEKENFERYQLQRKELDRIKPLENQISIFKKKKQYLRLKEQQEKYTRYCQDKKRLQGELDLLNQRVMANQATQIEALQKEHTQALKREQMEEELLKLKSARDQSKKILESKKELSGYQAGRGSALQEITEIQKLSTSIQNLQSTIDAGESLYVRQKLYQILAKGFGKAGQLRERQLSKFSHYLEQALLSHTARQLPNHRFKIIVDDGIDILASKSNGKLYDVKFMSGGEKGALSVAFLFALDDLLPPEKRTSIKIIDEIEANFDKERRADFIMYTLPALKKRAETVIVISHAPEANDSLFDVTWEVKDGMIKEKILEQREFEKI